jgi:hypothetical protein
MPASQVCISFFSFPLIPAYTWWIFVILSFGSVIRKYPSTGSFSLPLSTKVKAMMSLSCMPFLPSCLYAPPRYGNQVRPAHLNSEFPQPEGCMNSDQPPTGETPARK